MAIIQPTHDFDGAKVVTSSTLGKIIDDQVKQVSFAKGQNKDGLWLYILPSYKVDSQGRGVWYRNVSVRDNFGDRFKDRYVVELENDPIDYYERNLKIYFPQLNVRTKKEVNGKQLTAYPNHGRKSNRTLFNVAKCQKLEEGAAVLDLPFVNGADKIMAYSNTPGPTGQLPRILCDGKAATPIFLKLNLDSSGQPWEINIRSDQAAALPDYLIDSDFLYNLDQVTIKRTADELILKLKEMTHPEVFEKCMEGYPGINKYLTGRTVTSGFIQQVQSEPAAPAAPVQQSFPAFNTPAAPAAPAAVQSPAIPRPPAGFGAGPSTSATPAVPVGGPVPAEVAQYVANPVAGGLNPVDREKALAFLKNPRS